MNLRDLEYLVAVAEQRSFRSAATACGVSQPTLSVQLRKLEEELGVVLVDRVTSRPVLTPVGQQVVERARTVLAEVDAIRATAREATGEATELRLGVFPTLGPYLLPHVLPLLGARFPKLQVLLTEEKTQHLIALLHEGGLDAAVIAMPVHDPHLEVRPLFREEFVLAAPAEHPLAAGVGGDLDTTSPIPPDRVAEHELLVLDEGHCLGGQVQQWATHHGASLRKDYRATSLETLRHTITAGGGITLLPAMTVTPPVPSFPGLALRRIASPAPSRDIALVWPHASPRAATLAALSPVLVPSGVPLVHEL
jgi:oxidative stress transcriptional regulator, lysR family